MGQVCIHLGTLSSKGVLLSRGHLISAFHSLPAFWSARPLLSSLRRPSG